MFHTCSRLVSYRVRMFGGRMRTRTLPLGPQRGASHTFSADDDLLGPILRSATLVELSSSEHLSKRSRASS